MKLRHLILLCTISTLSVTTFAQSDRPDTPAKLISQTQFTLSSEASAAGIDGKVAVTFTVDKNGSVINVRKTGGLIWPCGKNPKKELAAAEEAIRSHIAASKFEPAMKDGSPISVDLTGVMVVGRIFQNAVGPGAAAGSAVSENTVVNLGMMAGRAKKLPKPAYPPEAFAARAQGAVKVDFLVNEKGEVISAGALTGDPLLHNTSRRTACESRFEPTAINGIPVKAIGTLTYSFAVRNPN